MHLIYEEDAVLGALQLFDDFLQALFELAAVLGAGDQRTDVQRDEALVEEHLRHLTLDDPLGERFDDGGLADAGLADEDRVVLGAAGEDLDDALDLLLAADDRVELAGARGRSKVDTELVDGGSAGGSATALGSALRHALGEDAGDFGADLVEADAEAFEDAGGDAFAFADEAEEQVLRADVVVAEATCFIHCEFDDFLGAGSETDLTHDGAVATADDELDGGADLVEFHPEVSEHLSGYAFALTDETEQEVFGTYVVVVEA